MFLFSYFKKKEIIPPPIHSPIHIVLDSSYVYSMNHIEDDYVNYTRVPNYDSEECQLTLPYVRNQSMVSPKASNQSSFLPVSPKTFLPVSPKMFLPVSPKMFLPVSPKTSKDSPINVYLKIETEPKFKKDYFNLEWAIRDVITMFFGQNVDVKIYD
jgi:hypothetical protein